MPSPKRRAKRYLGDLTSDQRFYLLYGRPIGDPFPDQPAARAAWDEHGANLTEDQSRRFGGTLVPWAAVRFDGATGHSSAFCGIGDPTCACRRSWEAQSA